MSRSRTSADLIAAAGLDEPTAASRRTRFGVVGVEVASRDQSQSRLPPGCFPLKRVAAARTLSRAYVVMRSLLGSVPFDSSPWWPSPSPAALSPGRDEDPSERAASPAASAASRPSPSAPDARGFPLGERRRDGVGEAPSLSAASRAGRRARRRGARDAAPREAARSRRRGAGARARPRESAPRRARRRARRRRGSRRCDPAGASSAGRASSPRGRSSASGSRGRSGASSPRCAPGGAPARRRAARRGATSRAGAARSPPGRRRA